MSDSYGKSEAEQQLDKIMTCREIVKTIMNFGVTQEQLVLIIQNLAYELENHDHMVEVVALTKEILSAMGTTLFVEKQ